MLLGDQPISNSSQDRLDRADFCRHLAGAISGYKSSECIVLGLLGTWGSGKSSILNMTIEFLDKSSKSQNSLAKPIIVRFNPWNYPDPDKILTQFFYNLSSKLKSKRLKTFQKLGDKVSKYADSFTPFEVSISTPKKPISLRIRKPYRKSIDFRKEDLTKDFQKIKNKIIIIIDDVDRLNRNEIRKIFQLTKAFGNLPNIIYIVAFDRKIVSRALSDDQSENGEEYLEKIIQVPFEIPSIPRDKVLGILQFQLNEIINNIPGESWDQEYWYNIYQNGIRNFFSTIRDINRYINTLKISLPFVVNEIDPIDFIAITCFQVFLPKLYSEIKDNKNLLVGEDGEASGESHEGSYRDKEIIENMIGLVPESNRDNVKRLLCYLFPKLNNVFGRQGEDPPQSKKLSKQARIYNANFFDTYFRLSVPEYEITQDEINKLIGASESEKRFSSILLSLNGKGKTQVVVERLKDRINEITPGSGIKVVNSLLDNADKFRIEDVYNGSIYKEIAYLCINLLFRIEDEDERFNILQDAIKKAKGLYISTILMLELIKESKKGKFLIDGFKVIALEDIVLRKIREWARGKDIKKHQMWHEIIYNWSELEDENQAREFLNLYIKDHEGFLSFISSNLQKKYILKKGDHFPTMEFDIDTEKIINFIDMPSKELESRIENIIASKGYNKLDNKQKDALNTFIKKRSLNEDI